MKTDELMLKVENVSKVYRLGEIGGTTLRDELQRLKARILHKEDPTKKIGAKNYNKGEKFKALNNVTFEVRKGERIGIIGHNGAGKSTLLKLISRVTGPSAGKIYLNGRVASMLEVGTGFHPELTGRENVYMNGAILGMTKKEIDAKMEDIIEFSEVRQFIDTPVKRYSSGMYVKLAFSVAAHLNSEIMIMDEVLAVGDLSFQNKCLQKMKNVSEQDNKTILYVSHSMPTIRKLCNRVIVLNHGQIVYDGDVETGIDKYINNNSTNVTRVSLENNDKKFSFVSEDVNSIFIDFVEKKNNVFDISEDIKMRLAWKSLAKLSNVFLRLSIHDAGDLPLATCLQKVGNSDIDEIHNTIFTIKSGFFAPGTYCFNLELLEVTQFGSEVVLDEILKPLYFQIVDTKNGFWSHVAWGYIKRIPLTINDSVCSDKKNDN